MLKRFTPVLVIVALCWIVFWTNYLIWHGQLNQYGIIPRRLDSLAGILWAPFLHASLKHLTANTLPLLLLGGIICARGQKEFNAVTAYGVLLGGVLTWLFGRTAIHIGASGLVFCCFGYIASLAWFRRTFGALLLSVFCLVAYGGLLRGVLPTSLPISWEGHLAGLVAGIVVASTSAKGVKRGR
ncbi:MAG TPA: rhomboid family intramembrane serine protease [Clostridia bacterium]|nr:rhomboid family intramembrane serine protease [Clostridia bacterium]